MTDMWFGCKRGKADVNVPIWKPEVTRAVETRPASVNLQSQFPKAWDQGPCNCCTGNVVAAAIQFARVKTGLAARDNFLPSRMMLYYDGREVEGQQGRDGGCAIGDVLSSASQKGFCHEDLWPYIIHKTLNKPADIAYIEGKKYQVTSYYRIAQNMDDLRQCLADGWPFVMAMSAYNNMKSLGWPFGWGSKTLPVPPPPYTGGFGHAVVIVGCDDSRKCFRGRNSWGSGWADGGYFWLPYDYAMNALLAFDFYTVRGVSA